ncbi:MAG: transcriptional regulator [Nitrospirota bacterium]
MTEELTIRQEIKRLITNNMLTAKMISKMLMVKEKDVIDHLNHIAMSVGKKDFIIEPSMCMKCGFVFNKRERLTSPSRCPICKHEGISEPRFGIKKEDWFYQAFHKRV